ncbi:DUF3991 domain-containing protein [[Eubacterium] hominis]|uniref:DUF3991 domain-containing protein n=1 Tax=[Eubacterium] hominis TaxID=2764325 RepID=UPI003A4D4E04
MSKKIPESDMKRIRELDLLTYFKNYEPQDLVKNGHVDYTTKSHTSLHMSHGLWMHWSSGIGGKTALDFLIKIENMSFRDAAMHIKSLIDLKEPLQHNQRERQTKKFRLPYPAENDNDAIAYLTNERCIDRTIVEYCHGQRLFYQESKEHCIVFVGYDEHHYPRFACKRSLTGDMKKDVWGSDKSYGFSLVNENNDSLHVFESAIDLLSYMTLLKQAHRDYKSENYLAISGASTLLKDKNLEESMIPIALKSFLKRNPQIKELHLHLDNDKAGHDTTKKIMYHLSEKYEVLDERPNTAKDVNLLLQNKIKKRMKYQER